ncbi:hypothetical protein SAMD00019534_098340 [Acytostelium subglobosum LB1]|uniref:hypothetical protein n=1 Tax=Acytostelium subglobosum LB1 TaxID=1410327 RepID=UPI000645105C|nr:hypothetical protein SAMD00019534_098340 [Acytostelium subglobosum LB1]GAM26659.1 hypothetical protein SAMD00019534_098340 [Acytostelium subglobosum LB1]|eukprot:XP_012750320.1 hypothetical protein SAMD00019534_098340 [Acytostelium subglobosum LB1]
MAAVNPPVQIPMNVTVTGLYPVDKKNGYLKKLGGKGISKNWRRRYFVLTESGILYYFKQRNSTEPVGAVDLSQYTKCFKDNTKKNYFFLNNENDSSQRVFHLIADSPEEMDEWIRCISTFFEGDISDFKSQMMGLKQQKTDSKLNLSKGSGGAPSSEEQLNPLDKFQLVFKGERVSLLLQSEVPNGGSPSSTREQSPNASPKVAVKNPPPIPARKPTLQNIDESKEILQQLQATQIADNSFDNDDDDDEDN